MELFLTFWSVVTAVLIGLVLLLIGLALIPALRAKSLERFFIAFFQTLFGIIFPLSIFLASSFMVPHSKFECRYGWIDCFYLGKLALTPLVLWASSAFYAVEILRAQYHKRPWIVIGIFQGAVISTVCFVFGVVVSYRWFAFVDISRGWVQWLRVVPLYVLIWYWVLSIQIIQRPKLRLTSYIIGFCVSFPIWAASIFWSIKHYLSLPEETPECFVVTAALRGHTALVGPLFEIRRQKHRRYANQQLLTFWQLEAFWKTSSPQSHKIFRRAYNIIGPTVARRINAPLRADIVYVSLKPLEYFARLILCLERTEKPETNKSMPETTNGAPDTFRSSEF